MVLVNQEINGYSTLADLHVLPTTHVNFAAGQDIKAYINSKSTPEAKILFKGTVFVVKNAPAVCLVLIKRPQLG